MPERDHCVFRSVSKHQSDLNGVWLPGDIFLRSARIQWEICQSAVLDLTIVGVETVAFSDAEKMRGSARDAKLPGSINSVIATAVPSSVHFIGT
jgi:hypothetical protein